MIQQHDVLVVEHGDDLRVVIVKTLLEQPVDVDGSQISVTTIEVIPTLPLDWARDYRSLVIHFNMVDGGELTAVGKANLIRTDFSGDGVPIEGISEPLPPWYHIR